MKKTLYLLVLSLAVISIMGFRGSKEESIGGIKFSECEINMKAKGKFEPYIVGRLEEKTLIDGYLCDAYLVKINKDGELLKFRTAQTIQYKGIAVPAKTWITRNEKYFICEFPVEVMIQGYKVYGGPGRTTETKFYDNGKLESFATREYVTINGIKCSGSQNSRGKQNIISLHQNGKLKSCVLAENHTIDGVSYKNGTELHFNENGKVVKK